MRKIYLLPVLIISLVCSVSYAQVTMFDDFNYSSNSDPSLSFNKWLVVDGLNGPPDGAQYKKANVSFVQDTSNLSNKIVTLATTVNTVNGQKKLTHSRIETDGYEYFEGTYAARVYFDDTPFTYKDANIQTFYTIVYYLLGEDGSKYSELDFEYMASDKWYGASQLDVPVMYLTGWNRYIADPWQAWKSTKTSVKSWKGWHTLVMQANDGTNVKFWMDGTFYGSMSVTDNDGTSVYPRSNMQVAFANWIWDFQVGSSNVSRTTTMAADWVLYLKNKAYSPVQVDTVVQNFRDKYITRKNLKGQVTYNIPTATESQEEIQQIEVYPNPSISGLFALNTSIENGVVTDLLGNIKLNITNSSLIDLSGYESGVYLLKTNFGNFKLIKN